MAWNWKGELHVRGCTVNFQNMLYFCFNLQIDTYCAENLAHNLQFQENKQSVSASHNFRMHVERGEAHINSDFRLNLNKLNQTSSLKC